MESKLCGVSVWGVWTSSEEETYVLNQCTLMLECITLAEMVKFVVEMLVDFARRAVFDEQPSEDTLTAHPDDLTNERKVVSSVHQVKPSDYCSYPSKISMRTLHKLSIRCVGCFLPRHSRVCGTLPLTEPTMSPDPPRSSQIPSPSSRVHGNRLSDDETIGNEFADCLAGVGLSNLSHLIWVEPDLALAAAHHGGGQALLGAEVDPKE